MDNVNSPKHYQIFEGIEAIDIIKRLIELNGDSMNQIQSAYYFNILSYLFRFGRKDGIQDLKKSRYYIDKMIEDATEPQVYFAEIKEGGSNG